VRIGRAGNRLWCQGKSKRLVNSRKNARSGSLEIGYYLPMEEHSDARSSLNMGGRGKKPAKGGVISALSKKPAESTRA